MSSSRSPNSESVGKTGASKPIAPDLSEPNAEERSDLEAEAVKTFAFDVTAGRSAKPEDADLPLPPAPQPKFIAFQPALGSNLRPHLPSGAEFSSPKALADAPIEKLREDSDSSQLGIAPIVLRPKPMARRQSSWWAASLGLHGVILLLLGFTTLVVTHEEKIDLYASPAVHEAIEELDDLEIDATEDLESLEEEFNDTLEELDDHVLTSESLLDPSPLKAPPVGEPASAGGDTPYSEIGALLGEGASGLTDLGTGVSTGTDSTMAKFFGTEVKARRILYMLDNSGGMRKGGKFEALVSELQASVNALDPKQQFYVIFYSDTVYPLFFPQSVRRFVKANDKNRDLLRQWLDSVELCGGNAIDEALAAAAVIRPEAVFLLTDGDLFTTDEKKSLLLNNPGRPYPIHTFGLGVGAQTKTATGLRQVAEANGGTFRAIKISAEMKALAQEKERPYHSKEPGPVWGIKVGKW